MFVLVEQLNPAGPWHGFRRAMGRMAVGSAADLDPPRHRFRLLRNRDGQNSVLSGCIDLLSVYRIRQNEAPMKRSIAALDATTLQVFTVLRRDLLESIAGESKYSSVER
jgi:hypothetical protein